VRPAGASGPVPTRLPALDPLAARRDPGFDEPAVRGAPVAPSALTADALRARFRAPPPWEPEARREERFAAGDEVRDAAVLVGLVQRPESITVLLTERTAHLNDHAGQISFPGGRSEAGDADPVATALRESAEEVGLPPAKIEVLGTLPLLLTGTGFAVTPVVGLVMPPFTLMPDPFEVAEVFEVPLAFLMDPARHERRIVATPLGERTFYAIPYRGERLFFIWGATAAILRNLYRFLRA
jgi:8-oxo-dGTP pyrophosphatase MutT (NUDIX family)